VSERFLTPGEVGALLRVDPKTVTRWCKIIEADGKPRMPSIRTPGGHRRIPESAVRAILNAPP
jgi:excisionase family DNA binding protein